MRKDKSPPAAESPVNLGIPQYYGGGAPVGWVQSNATLAGMIGQPFTVEADGSIVPLLGEVVTCTASEPVEGEGCTFFADTMTTFYRQCIDAPLPTSIKPSFVYLATKKASGYIAMVDSEDFTKHATGKVHSRHFLKTGHKRILSAVPPLPGAEKVGRADGEFLLDMAQQRTETFDEESLLRRKSLELLGLADTVAPIGTTEQLIEAIAAGFPSSVLKALRRAGWTYELMDKVIVPRRTLMRRKATGQTLTPTESDAAWRLAVALAAASVVFTTREAALEWLMRPKSALRDRSPAELLQSSVGTDHVLAMLRRIDHGDFV